MPVEKVVINISKELYDKIALTVSESNGEFKNVDEYIEFVLAELTQEERVYTPEEEREIHKRLSDLGYM